MDRGANGGLAGDDVKVLECTGFKVDVGGIDGHTVQGLEIVTAAGRIETNVCPMLGILNQYAQLGKGKTIHSAGQLEHFRNTVDDKSKKVGGRQCITTPHDIVIPLSIREGLSYLDMKYPTDKEVATLPRLYHTSDMKWDPAVLDHEYPIVKAIADYPADLVASQDMFNIEGNLGKAEIADVAVPPALLAMEHVQTTHPIPEPGEYPEIGLALFTCSKGVIVQGHYLRQPV